MELSSCSWAPTARTVPFMGGLPGFPREDRAYGRVAAGLCSIRNLVETREGVTISREGSISKLYGTSRKQQFQPL